MRVQGKRVEEWKDVRGFVEEMVQRVIKSGYFFEPDDERAKQILQKIFDEMFQKLQEALKEAST